jgi:hypothetical protein
MGCERRPLALPRRLGQFTSTHQRALKMSKPGSQSYLSLSAWLLGTSLIGLGGCSPAGVRDWAVQVQDSSAQGFAEQENRRQLSAWQAAGEGGAVRRPPPETPAENTDAKPADGAADQPPPPPQYIFVMPAQP